MQSGVAFLCLLVFVQAGPYTRKGRPVAETHEVGEAQFWLQDRLIALELRMLAASKDVGRLAEETTREAYRMTDEAQVGVEALIESITNQARKIRPLHPHCANNAEVRKVNEKLNNVTLKVLECTHKVSDDAAGFEVGMTVQLSDARGQIWDVQEAMYYCEKFRTEVDTDCVKRLTVEGLQVLTRLPDRVFHVLDSAQASREEAQDRLRTCFMRGMSQATEIHLAHTQRVRECEERTMRSEE